MCVRSYRVQRTNPGPDHRQGRDPLRGAALSMVLQYYRRSTVLEYTCERWSVEVEPQSFTSVVELSCRAAGERRLCRVP